MPVKFPNCRFAKVLVLIPGFNGVGRTWLEGDNEWTQFADLEGILLIGPSFNTTMEEVRAHRGYYYPALWSGEATLRAVEEIGRRERVPVDKFMIFGFSAGAHFAHGFALWKPERVSAFVAYSAGWWDKPTLAAKAVPGLIMCGEGDERYEATRAFMAQAADLKLPWMWRSYAGVGHEIRPPVIRMAQSFLKFYASQAPPPGGAGGAMTPPAFIGDIQRYVYFAADSEEARNIPADQRVPLPSREVAEAWKTETPQ